MSDTWILVVYKRSNQRSSYATALEGRVKVVFAQDGKAAECYIETYSSPPASVFWQECIERNETFFIDKDIHCTTVPNGMWPKTTNKEEIRKFFGVGP